MTAPGRVRAASAVGSGATTLPLWAVCLVVFVALLLVSLLLLLGPRARAQRDAHQSRSTELRRYRLLSALSPDVDPDVPVASVASTRSLTTSALGVVDRAVRARGRRGHLVGQLERSGLRMRPEEWAAIQLSVIAGCAALGVFFAGSVLGGVVGGPVGWLACRLFVSRKISRRVTAFEAQLPDALQLVAGALRSGFGLNQSIAAVAREGSEPVASEFARVLQEARLGAELEDALDDLAGRLRSYDMELVVMAIRTAREIGGNLAEVLQTTVTTMRERVQLRAQVRVLSAEGRFSAKILTGMPILMAVYLLLFKKGYLTPMYTTSVGIVIFIIGGVLLVIGSLWLSRLTKIEV